LNSAEEDVSPGIDPETKFKLERIIKSKQGVGIVAIHGNVCTGCHMILPAQFANIVRIGEKIVYCPYCSRILYYSETAEGEDIYFNDDDAGSLADLDDFIDEDEEDGEDGDSIDDEKMEYED
ncbi:MAG TPA: C4-type zinc ribbon domain-containing protein, partial [Treponemataceae bacterium]|nr:C4-type zinc ribbon domain-containing protein [Treponemataceae bacterium]